MAGSSNDTSFINPTDSGFPAYLDFTTLRSNAINYLGPITGKYWTDYNIHDPGITTLEVLLYAIMDLGYRVNLPIGNLLASSGSGTGAAATGTAGPQDSNFFTAAQVFGCQPTTELDYRKLLMDIDEVRNAWLEPARGSIKGLYEIYLETEKDVTDFSTTMQWEKYKGEIAAKVRKTMHGYRNLCEDVEKIVFLKKKAIGVNADIELQPGSSVAETYLALIKKLYTFFSPVPRFYTLGQITALGDSMDTIFEGRPYTGRASHGFLRDEEMPIRPLGAQSIYRSAVINAMTGADLPGVKTVRSFALLNQDKKPLASSAAGWVFPLEGDEMPAFSLQASTFRWFQNGQLLTTQLGAYNRTLQLNALYSGKVIYLAGPPALDAAIPSQAPLDGLGDYYSIQNDYPLVYGIGPGGLPPSVSKPRQSQALQFKGYLLFFDQLLADYLAQLSNVGKLFSMSPPAGGRGNTYFGGNLSTVPGLDALLRFPPSSAAGGATLMYPVAAAAWKKFVDGDAVEPCASVPGEYIFGSALERDTAVATLTVLFGAAKLTLQTIRLNTGQWKYYFTDTTSVFVLASKNSFSSQASATGEAMTVQYIGANKDNYALVSLGDIASYTFNLVASGSAYYSYLQSILEDPAKYTQRRTAFLEHLLARFAESFTDYALLAAGSFGATEIADNQVGLMQGFLSEWPVLSADRGKGYDYRKDGWDNVNVSGLEARFKAYCGIGDRGRHYLCNFEVDRLEESFYVLMAVAGEELFASAEPLIEKEAVPAVFSLFDSMGMRENYRVVYQANERSYFLETAFYGNFIARSIRSWPDETGVQDAIDTLCRMWQLAPTKGDIEVSEYQYRFQLLDYQQQVRVTGERGFMNERDAYEDGKHSLGNNFCPNTYPEFPANQFADIAGYKIYTRQDVLGRGKARRWGFELLDEDNSFRFRGLSDFDTEGMARDACCQLLHFLADARFYVVRKGHGEWYTIVIRVGEVEWAESDPGWESDLEARTRISQISEQVRQRMYTLTVISRPYRWKFHFFLGIPGRGRLMLESADSFESQQEALGAARAFHAAGPEWQWREEGDELFLEAILPDAGVLICRLSGSKRPEWRGEAIRKTAGWLLEAKRDLYRLASGEEALARRLTVPDETSKEGAYVYRLVDKNHPIAYAPVKPPLHSPDSADPLTRREAEALREELILKARSGYIYLEICLGGDNVRVGDTPATAGQYYYQLRCRNNYFSRIGIPEPQGGIALFESLVGYADADAAQAAFQSTYLIILEKARHAENYGEQGYILLSDAGTVKQDEFHGPVVFVPAVTREAIHAAALDLVEVLSNAAFSYPIREEAKEGYGYVLGNGHHPDWESVKTYPTAAEAHVYFDFLLLLLNYAGNLFIEFDWKRCSYRVGIHEVLAESTHRFHDPAAAWEAVEKFICVAQSEGGIHPGMRADCSYSFFIACANRRAVHPCWYESAKQRDQALETLMQEAGYFSAGGWMEYAGPHHFSLLDGRGHPLAMVPMPTPDLEDDVLNRILDIADALWAGREPQRYGSEIQLVVGKEGDQFAIMPAESWPEAVWLEKLKEFAARFPVVRDTAASYTLEMKSPGFEDPSAPTPSAKDCGCQPAPNGGPLYCYLAWKSDKVYPTASDAWTAWLRLLPLLTDKENYRPVFAKEIGYYGIELLEKKAILARNPQYYPYAAMAVEKIERALACINSEGLDVVEHLLLRPGISGAMIPACDEAGPCGSMEFGGDPYSFIVTVALPAWPARFRSAGNRVLLETILQREMPAHILARILWLVPGDMCRFEYLYAGWIDALGRKGREQETRRPAEDCAVFEVGELLKFLFKTPFGCLADCTECTDERDVSVPADDTGWLDQINRLYCWTERPCAEKWEHVEEPSVTTVVEIVEWPVAREEEAAVALAVEPVEPRPEARTEARPPDLKLVRRIQALRRSRYERRIGEWLQTSGEEALAENAGRFLLDPDPSKKRFQDLLKEIMKGARKGSAKSRQREELAAIVLSIYLDRIIMAEEQEERWQQLRPSLEKVRGFIGDAVAFYAEWLPEEMIEVAPAMDIDKLQALLREIQKGEE
jgi:hypothetical protein